ncbi:flavin-dependent monooxygenase [Gynuella sunshinyii]|uniref:Acyl-CoA dehydrogenase n=1 Tax=Gynuella sunshinyii YC6258 TaxID=1445510 RepID=A0A0C5VU08_9GAMM|nr:flavin-dependent monooxygenase [Gynuella sunshinyii]AJQ93849.1 acyl-CoA dehydrogenase [Gynuella sunshinyii YC6258]
MNLLNNINQILPAIRNNAAEAEKIAMVPQENIDLLKQTGFFRALQPKAFGGLEVSYPEYANCIARIAEACASTAWATGLLANHSHAIALFAPKLQNEIWGENPEALVSSSVAPLGQWEKTEGGIRLSGTFGWSSGCDHADWAVLGYMGTNNMGQPGPCFAVVPRSDYEILDDWDTAALRGTGSKSLVLKDVFVPEYRTESLFGLNFGLSRGYKSHSGDIFYTPFSPVFSIGFAAVSLGIAKRFIELFTEKTKTRIRAYSGAREINNAPAQMYLAESVNQTKTAQLLLENDWREMMDRASQQRLPSPDDVLNWRCQQSYAIKILIEAVNRLSMASGGNAWFSNNEMQRLFRDIRITGCHAQTDYTIASQTFGRHLLGLGMDAKYY